MQVANDQQNNYLSKYIKEHFDGFPCLMWYPNERILLPVKSMQIDEFNARLLEVKYYKPHWHKKPAKITELQHEQFSQFKESFSYEMCLKDNKKLNATGSTNE